MTPAEVASLGPAFQADWDRDFAPFPTRPDMLCGVVNAFLGDPSLVEAGQYMTMGVYTAYPYSRGSIHINSPTDVLTGYEFDTGFLTHPSDIKKQLWAYKTSREIARRLPYYRGELALGHPNFRDASKAKLHDGPLLGEGVTDIEYDDDDDRAIEEWIRMNLNTTWHSLGTCAMRAKVDGGVVSPDLNVWDTEGLKIVDVSSVIPCSSSIDEPNDR